jgi:hypothetical protein
MSFSLRIFCSTNLRKPIKIHFGGQANLFDSDRRQAKAALASTKADLPWLPEVKKLLLAAQKQLLELPLIYNHGPIIIIRHKFCEFLRHTVNYFQGYLVYRRVFLIF